MQNQPETILQFGAGRFLRGFFDRFVHQANLEGQNVGRIVIVQSTPGSRANTLADQKGAYHALYRGVEDGQVVDRPMKIESVSRALVAGTNWPEILKNTGAEGYPGFMKPKNHPKNLCVPCCFLKAPEDYVFNGNDDENKEIQSFKKPVGYEVCDVQSETNVQKSIGETKEFDDNLSRIMENQRIGHGV